MAEGEEAESTLSSKPSTSPDFWVYSNHSKMKFDNQGRLDQEGKWMLFYPKEELDHRWEVACELFSANRFGDVTHMKVSTFRPNPRASNSSQGVIILYTPSLAEQEQKRTGYAIMNAMQYFQSMYYKTDLQTRSGTSATGQTKNYTYVIDPIIPNPFANISWD